MNEQGDILMKKKSIYAITAALVVLVSSILPSEKIAASEDNSYYLGTTQEKDDAGYEQDKEMKSSDIHSGWELGQFCINGYTRQTTGDDGNPLFLKNVGDKVSLSFLLNQDISELNGDDAVSISDDTNGYDNYFGISKSERTDFGQGTLLIKYTDYQNKTSYLEPYTNYLQGVEKGATTEVQFFEEGDYEIALDYEIRKNNIDFWKIHTAPSYTHYQILIKFSVRNGNCMVYPFDVTTGTELINTSFTENGFYLDLAKSRYLTIDVQKQNYVESDGTLIEDTRFNKPASDGEKFTDEGVYLIKVKNLYTGSETEKKIYIGSDPILKAYVTTGKDIDYIKEMISEGATIEDDGTITLVSKEVIESDVEETEEIRTSESDENVQTENKAKTSNIAKFDYKLAIAAVTIVIILFIVLVNVVKKRKKAKLIKKSDDVEGKE